MGFTETTFFFVFLPSSIIIYLLIDRVFQNKTVNNSVLAALSFIFYYWAQKETLLVFIALCLFTYMAGKMAEAGKSSRLFFPFIFLVGVLVFYKYASLLSVTINRLFDRDINLFGEIVVPIGLSFVIFESISYIADIYRKDAPAGTLLECLTFLSLFSKLVSGPIVLWKDFQPQLTKRKVTIDGITLGIDKIIIGLTKKILIADSFGAQIASIDAGIAMGAVDVPTIWIKSVLFFFQLYFDFSGYSDMAIGLSSVFGFSINENFRYPYLSRSISEFWRRWHISLGSWFREYVYIPLGGNRRGNVYVHLLVVFVLTGIWHGAGFQFLLWGLIHGVFILLERAVRDKKWYIKIPGVIKWVLTITIVFFAWVLFMSKDILSAGNHYVDMFIPITKGMINFSWRYYLNRKILVLLFVSIFCQACGCEKVHSTIEGFSRQGVGLHIKRMALLLLLVVDIIFLVNASYNPFLYFQF